MGVLQRLRRGVKLFSQQRAKQRTVEHIVDGPFPQMLTDIVEAVKSVPRECGEIFVQEVQCMLPFVFHRSGQFLAHM